MAGWTHALSSQVRTAGLELVTLIREQPTPERRADAITRYISSVYLPSLPKQHRAQGLGMLIAGLALDFAEVLDGSPEASGVFLRYALATAGKPLG